MLLINMPTIQQQLQSIVDELRIDLIASLKAANRIASGNTESQITAEANDTHAQLLAPFWIYALQDGRKPTSENAATGDPTLFEAIQAWCVAKGIDQKAAYPITKHIHEYGYPGTPGIIDEPLSDENVERVMRSVLDNLAYLYTNMLVNEIFA